MQILTHVFRYTPILFLFLLAGCNSTKNGGAIQGSLNEIAPPPVKQKKAQRYLGSIAIADIEMKHPTAKLAFRKSGVRDRITRTMHESEGFKVIDWSRLESVLFRRNLESSDLVDNDRARREVAELLLNDFFLYGSVTFLGERMEYSSSAFSKEKTQVTDVELDLFIKNSLTNEIIASATGKGNSRRKITQTLGFGAAGGTDTVAAHQAMDKAIGEAVQKLVNSEQLIAHAPVERHAPTKTEKQTFHEQPGVKVLFILSEIEEKQDGRIIRENNVENFTNSTVEHSMAKVFSDSKYQVLTADDVLGKAYGISGDENILLSGWIDEQDIEEFENLLQARSGLASYAFKVGRVARADIVISGVVKYQGGESVGPGKVKAKTNLVELTAKAHLISTRKTYHIATVEEKYMAVLVASKMKAREKALKNAAEAAAVEILLNTPVLKK